MREIINAIDQWITCVDHQHDATIGTFIILLILLVIEGLVHIA
jgi:hypothetical protein